MIIYFKRVIFLVVFIGFSTSYAGSYDDFFSAIRRDNSRDIKALLDRGFDPNSISMDGQFGLLVAFGSNSWNVARTLIAHPSTDIDVRNSNDETPIMIAALRGRMDLCQALIDREANLNKPGWTALHYAATLGDPKIVQLLLDHFAYIDAESPNRTTPLMMAAMYGSDAAVKVLLEAGADVSLRNALGLSALDFATKAKKQASVNLIEAALVESKADGK